MRRLLLAAAVAFAALLGGARAAHAACATNCNVALIGGDQTTIQGCVNTIPVRPAALTGDACVNILDNNNYSETVDIRNIDTAGYRIYIGTVTTGVRPGVTPPSAATVFTIANASVTIEGLDIEAAFAGAPFGILASSGSVLISSVRVANGVGSFANAGILLSSASRVVDTLIDVGSAYGLWLNAPAGGTSVELSTISNNSSAGLHTVYLQGSDRNDITTTFMTNLGPSGAVLNIEAGSDFNTVSYSTMTSATTSSGLQIQGSDHNTITGSYVRGSNFSANINNSDSNTIDGSTVVTFGGRAVQVFNSSGNVITNSFLQANGGIALHLDSAAFKNTLSFSTAVANSLEAVHFEDTSGTNTVTSSYLQSNGGVAARIEPFSHSNLIAQSTMSSNIAGFPTLVVAGDSNTVTGSLVTNPAGYAATFEGGAILNTISLSTAISGSGSHEALYFNNTASNTVTGSYLRNTAAGVAAYLLNSNYNVIAQSTMTTGGVGAGLSLNASDNNTFTGDFMRSQTGVAVNIQVGSDFNTVSLSTALSSIFTGGAMFLVNSDSNVFVDSYFENVLGDGLRIQNSADFNQIRQSTVISQAATADVYGINLIRSSGVVVESSYVRGSTAVFVSGSTNTFIFGSVIIATNTSGSAVAMVTQSKDLRVTTSTLSSPGRGLWLSPQNAGEVHLGSVTVTGASRGLQISTQATGFVLSVDSVTFRGLAGGATAIHYLGGAHVSTITLANFEDGSMDVNVSAAALDALSRITMRAFEGDVAGPDFENDPNSLVEWTGISPFPGCAQTRNVGAGWSFASIQGAVNSLSGGLTGHTCIVIEDGAMYPEQVVIDGLQTNGSSLTIRSRDPVGLRALVFPPGGSQAAFVVRSASVNIVGLNVSIFNNMPYGIHASSGWVTISSVIVNSGGVGVTDSAVYISSWTTIAGSTFTTVNGHGLRMPGAHYSRVFDTRAANNTGSGFSLYLEGTSRSTFTRSYFENGNGRAARLSTGSDYNEFSLSTFSATAPGQDAVYVSASSSNTFSQSAILSNNSYGLQLYVGSQFNLLSQSTVTTNGGVAVAFQQSSSNTVRDTLIESGNGVALAFGTGAFSNSVARTTATSTGAGLPTIQFANGASTNVLVQVTASNTNGGVAELLLNARYNRVERSSFSAQNNPAILIDSSTGNIITTSYMVSRSSHGVRLTNGSHYNALSSSTFSADSNFPQRSAIQLEGVSSNTITDVFSFSPYGSALNVSEGANQNTVSRSSFSSTNTGFAAVLFNRVSSNTFDASFVYSAQGYGIAVLDSDNVRIARSTAVVEPNGTAAIALTNSSSMTVTDVKAFGATVTALEAMQLSHSAITRSTFTSGGAVAAFSMSNSTWNVLNDVYAEGFGSARALYMQNWSNFNQVSNSTFSGTSGNTVMELLTASSNTFSNIRVRTTSASAAKIGSQSHWNTILASTFTTVLAFPPYEALRIESSSGTRIGNSYIEGVTGILINASSWNTFLNANRLVGSLGDSGGTGCAVRVTNAGQVTVTSNTISSLGDGVCLDNGAAFSSGVLLVASNTITSPVNSVRVQSQMAGTEVWVSSNVILPQPGSSPGTGISIDGLSTGGTFYNNSIYYRVSGGAPAMTQSSIKINGSNNVLVERNRINMPNMISQGSYRALDNNMSGVYFHQNDVNVVSLTNLSSVYLVGHVGGGGSLVLRENIFASTITSLTAGTTYTYFMSGGGYSSDFNVFYSSYGAPYFQTGGFDLSGLAAWYGFVLQDAASTVGHPRWANTAAGAEDFHVQSTAGRCTNAPGCTAFTNDQFDSAALDAGNPTSPYDLEPAPNGYHANAGSTGGTAEASKSPSQGCAVLRRVCKGGGCPFSSIQAAVNSIPNPLVGYSCVSIRDTATYTETVSVSGFTLAGSSISITADPAFSTGAVLQPVAGAGADDAILSIRAASVTVSGLTINSNGFTYGYGVLVSSPSVRLSSVSVLDSFGSLMTAGMVLSTESALSYSTISIGNMNASALISSGSWLNVSFASMSATGGGAFAPVLDFKSWASSATLTDVQVRAHSSKGAVRIADGTNYVITRATFSSTGSTVLSVEGATGVSLSQAVLTNYGASGQAVSISSLTRNVSIDRGIITGTAMTAIPAMQIQGSGHVLSNMSIAVSSSGAGEAVGISVGAADVRFSSFTLWAVGGPAFYASYSTGVTVEHARISAGERDAVNFYRGGGGHVVTDSTMTTAGSAGYNALTLNETSSNTVTRSYIGHTGVGAMGFGVELTQSSSNTITRSTVVINAGSAGFHLNQSGYNYLADIRATASDGTGIYFNSFSSNNYVERATITAAGISRYGAVFNSASSNTFSQSVVVSMNFRAFDYSMSSHYNSIYGSTAIGHGDAEAAVYVNATSSNVFMNSYFSAPSGYGLRLASSDYNQVLRSTVASGRSNYPALSLEQSNWNVVDQSVIIATGNVTAARLGGGGGGSSFNRIDRSSMTASRGLAFSVGFEVSNGSGNVVENSFISGYDGAYLVGTSNRISYSTVNASSMGVYLTGQGGQLSHSYVNSVLAVSLATAQYARIGSNRIIGTGLGGRAVDMSNSNFLSFTSNTVTGPASGSALEFGAGNSGYNDISTNTFLPGAMYQIYVPDFGVGSTLWFTSNTVLPTVSASTNSYGFYFNGLTRGATVQDNNIFYRGSGVGMGSYVTYGFFARNSAGIKVDHNRYSQPGVITGPGAGGSTAFHFSATAADFQFNDVYSKGTLNTAPYQIQLVAAPSSYIRNNIFVNDIDPFTGEAVTIYPTDGSSIGLNTNYNDIHLPGVSAFAGNVSGANRTFDEWQGFGYDTASISQDPVWVSSAAEDFHVRTAATNGRYNPATGLFDQTDLTSSPTIDAADPAAAVLFEGFPGASRANQGSYGQTGQASRAAPPPGCASEYTVAPGYYANIGAALAVVDDGPLTNNACIVIRQPTVTAGIITVPSLVTNGFRLTIMGEPGIDPVYQTTNNTDGFVINSASVTIKDLVIRPTANITNVIRAVGSDVAITSVTLDGATYSLGNAITISTRSSVSYSSVSTRGTAIRVVGANASISFSTAIAISVNGVGLRVDGASGAVVTEFYAQSAVSSAGVLGSGARDAAISFSTFTSGTGNAFGISFASRNALNDVILSAPNGTALTFQPGAYDNVMLRGSATSGGAAAAPAVLFDGASSNTVTQTNITHSGSFVTVQLRNNARLNTVSELNLGGFSSQPVLELIGASSNTFSQLYMENFNGNGVRLLSGSLYNRFENGDVVVNNAATVYAMSIDSSSGTAITDMSIRNNGPSGTGLSLTGGSNHTRVDASTITASGNTTFDINTASYTTVTRTLVANSGNWIALSAFDSHGGVFTRSTVTTGMGANAFFITNGRDNLVGDSYVEGGQGLYVTGSLRTSAHANKLVATSAVDPAFQAVGGASGLSISSNTLIANFGGKGISIEAGVGGDIIITTNTVPYGPQNGIRVVSLAAGAKVFIASNTVVPALGPTTDTCGLCLDTLNNGATIQNNSIYYRQAGSMAGFIAYGIYAGASHGLVIERNRVSNPGMVTAGGYTGVYLLGSPRARFAFNDVYSAVPAGGSISDAYGLRVETSSSVLIVHNVFSSSLTVTNTSATFRIDGVSTAGSDSDYNIHFSSTARNTMIDSAGAYEYPLAGSIDRNSRVYNPHWPSVTPGAEDFHPRSHAGRYVQATQSHSAVDAWTSGSVDHGDPTFPVGDEPASNGSRVNVGSYGGTAEASMTPPASANSSIVAVYSSSITVGYLSSGAPGYGVTASSGTDFTGVFVSSFTNRPTLLALAPQGLIPNTTYTLVASGVWGDAYVYTPSLSTPTLAVEPGAPGAVPFPAVHRTSMTATWTTSTNPLSQTTYTVTFAAATGNVSVSTLPSVTAAARDAVGLTPNTTYFVTVVALNHAGAVTAATVIGSTATRANEPLTAATTFHAVLDQSLSVSWGANANPLSITSYTVQASTAADFNAGASSVSFTTAPVFGPSAVVSGLTPATTYFFRVRALNGDGETTPYTVLASTVMLPLQIQAPAVQPSTATTINSITAVWGLSSNATGYTLYASTEPFNPPVTVWATSTTFGQTNTTATVLAPALEPNTTYYLFVRAHGFNGNSVYQAFPATVTLTATPAPAGVSFPVVNITSATVSWLNGGNPVDRTTFTVVLSTSGSFNPAAAGNVAVSSVTGASPSAQVPGLTPNTTYTAFVAAISHAGSSTTFVALGSTATRAALPAVVSPSSANVTDQAFDALWGSGGNPLGITSYTVVASTASDFNLFASSVVLTTAPASGPGARLTGLVPGTTYHLQVRALNGDGETTPYVGLGQLVTLPLLINAPGVQPVTSASTYSITAAWGLVSNATGYTLVASTMPDNPPLDVWASSSTFSQAATTATVFSPALQPNTTYFLFVRAHGFTSNSPYAMIPTTATLPATPVTAVTTFTMVSITSFTVSWLADGNPLGMTTYTVVASTASNFNAGASSVTLSTVPASGPSATLTGLGAYALWHVQVRALGQGVAVTPFVSLGSTQTLPVELAEPLVGATGVSASSMTAAWSLVSGATGYTLAASLSATNPPVSVIASSIVAAGDLSASVFGLAPNTTHYLFIRANGPGNSSLYSVYAATATDPERPLAAAATFSGVTANGAFVNWQQGVNPLGMTTYTVTLSTTPTFPNGSAGNLTSQTTYAAASPSQFLAGLTPNTTYHSFVESRSHGGSRFGTTLGSTATLANAPLPGAILAVGITSVTFSWPANGNPLGITSYTVIASTAADFNAFASSVVYTTAPAAGPSAVATGLAFGTSWYFQVQAVNHNGVPTAFASIGQAYTNLSNLIPLISDLQAGDDAWRRSNNGFYNMSFADASSFHLDKVQVSVSTVPGGSESLVAFTDAFGGLSPSDSYSTPFPLPAAVFNAMLESATNYVTVRVFNLVPATNTIVDAFYVRKDTTPPAFTNGELGGDSVVQTAAGRLYALSARDTASGLAAFQYSVSLTPASGDAAQVGWTDIAVLNGATDYTTAWPVAFAALQTGATNYVSVRAWDLAGATTTLVDAFRVLKDTTGPTVSISTPAAGTGFVSVVSGAAGGAVGAFGVQGAEVAVLNEGNGFYWNPASSLYNAVNPVWMAAVGGSSWTATLAGIPFTDSIAYKIVARSSTTYGLYSVAYATASFTLDTTTPTVAMTTPVPNSTVASLPLIAGTAADAGAAPSGVVTIEAQLRRLSDGLWWNWFTNAWVASPVSSVTAGGSAWSVTPSAQLQANLLSGASYYVAVRASDLALPANAGDFFAQGSTFTFNDPTPPAAITDLAAVNGALPGQISLTWTAQGAHGATGSTVFGQYAIFGSTDNLAVPSTSAASTIIFATAAVTPGAFQGYVESGLSVGVTYFIYVAMANADGNWSAFSNLASTTATPAPSNSILGHVVNASTQGITAVRIDAFDATGVLVATAFTLADGSGTYSVNGLTSGNYKVEASWTANGITSSVWIDAIPMGSVNIDFSLDINYALATLTGTLGALSSGPAGLGVSGSGYRPSAAGSHVELFQGGREVSRAAVGPTGRWTIAHLLPGTYAVRAYTGLTYTDFQNVELAEGEIRTVGFVFNPLPEASVFAFPNPARHSTTIRFETALQPLEAQIAIFDLKGGLVREVPGSQIVATATPGVYHYVWDLTNARGGAVASGVYLFMVKVKGGSENQLVKVIKKLAVVK